jgi:hypothetical protein
MAELILYLREHVTSSRPGSAYAYHRDRGQMVAACSRWILLSEFTGSPLDRVPESLRCRRLACRPDEPGGGGTQPEEEAAIIGAIERASEYGREALTRERLEERLAALCPRPGGERSGQ